MKKPALLLGCFVISLVALRCSNTNKEEASLPDGGQISEAGLPDGTVVPDGATCDPTQTPKENPCVISDTLAIFVAPATSGGSDTNPGTKEEPALTIGHGLTLALTTSTHRVIACASTYAESLSLTAPADDVGLALFGGVLCPGGSDAGAAWTYTGAQAVVQAPGPGPALQATGLTMPLTLEDVELDGPTVTAPGSSSVGAFLSGVTSAGFTNVKFVAENGTDGDAGTTGDNYAEAGPLSGNNARDGGPGAAVTCTCADATQTTGGAGSGVTEDAAAGAGVPAWGGGAAGVNGQACSGLDGIGGGGAGADAPAIASDGGASIVGSISASGWMPGGGAEGSNGPPGQGGGGGGNGNIATGIGPGGGGACGGCGGAGGTGGLAGGSSIALLAYQSAVTLTKCLLVAKNAGSGGIGASGQAGQVGNHIGGASSTSGGCSGGAGAAGAGGNGGGGGPGGISAGVAYSGTAPTIDGNLIPTASTNAIVTLGTAGAAGSAGGGGTAAPGGSAGVPGLPAAPGVSQAVVQVQ